MAAAVNTAPSSPAAPSTDCSVDLAIERQLFENLQHRVETFDPARLPRLSPLAARLSGMNVGEIDSPREFCRLIEHEPMLVARLIGLANSVAFGVPGKHFNTLEQALVRIGLHQSAQICFALLCSQAMGSTIAPRWRSALWVHALCTAASANKIARELETCDPNDAYLGGLIYDIGLMALECVQQGTLDAIATTAQGEGRPLRQVEDERAGDARTDHRCGDPPVAVVDGPGLDAGGTLVRRPHGTLSRPGRGHLPRRGTAAAAAGLYAPGPARRILLRLLAEPGRGGEDRGAGGWPGTGPPSDGLDVRPDPLT
jgi:hypothetical protein